MNTTITKELKTERMEPTVNINNNIFLYAVSGVMLFITALGYTFTNFSLIAGHQLSSTLIAGILGFASISLITKAVKEDKRTMNQQL